MICRLFLRLKWFHACFHAVEMPCHPDNSFPNTDTDQALLSDTTYDDYAASQDSDEEKPRYEYPGPEYDRGDGTVWPRPG